MLLLLYGLMLPLCGDKVEDECPHHSWDAYEYIQSDWLQSDFNKTFFFTPTFQNLCDSSR